MAKKVAGEMYEGITGQLFEIGRQLRQKNGYPFDPEELKSHLQAAIEGGFNIAPPVQKNPFLRHITHCTLRADDANDLREEEAVFSDKDFMLWKEQAREVQVDVYEVIKNGNFIEFFGSLGEDLLKRSLNPAIVRRLVKKHRSLIIQNLCGALYLFFSRKELSVAYAYEGIDGLLHIDVKSIGEVGIWCASAGFRLFVMRTA